MRKLTAVFLIFSTNLLFGQSYLDKDIKFQGSIHAVYQLKYRAIEKDGKLIKGDTIECSELKYEFDENNRLLTEEYCELDYITSYKYIYDEAGKLLERTNFNRVDRKYEYDELGNLKKELMFNSVELFGSWTYKYDDLGNRIERTGFLGDSFVERWIKIYDHSNRRIKEYMVGEEPDTIPTYMVITYEYDEIGRLIKRLNTNPDTQVQAFSTFKYDDNNNVIEYFSRNDFQRGIEEFKTYEYKYDEKGNWILRIEYYNSNPSIITERRIEYR